MRYPDCGPRRRWYAPWRVSCRCGQPVYPCVVEKMRGRWLGDSVADGEQIYDAGVEYARLHQSDERRRRRGAR